MTNRGVDLKFRSSNGGAGSEKSVWFDGVRAEHVELPSGSAFDFKWRDDAHFLALHDMEVADGETILDEERRPTPADLRDTVTFVPQGGLISGWTALAPRSNSFTALIYTPHLIEMEIEREAAARAPRPLLYIAETELRDTLSKLKDMLHRAGPADALQLETVALRAALAVDRVQNGRTPAAGVSVGRLTRGQESLVRDYIDQHLGEPLSLGELAGLARLSRFHFSRKFKTTFGASPQRYVLEARADRAKKLLRETDTPIAAVAGLVGYQSAARFSSAFRGVVGCSPSEYRRAVR